MNPTTPILQFVDVVKSYEAVTPVHARGVSLGVAAGEFVTVMGPSGCGKSTLHLASARTGERRRCVDGATSPTSPRRAATLRRRDLGYVVQRLNLVPA